MKRVLFLFLTIILLFSVVSCSDAVSDREAQKVVEAVLGDVSELPMDIEHIKNKLGDDVLFEDSEDDDKGDSVQLAIGNGVAVVRTVTARDTSLDNGLEYRFTITVVHFGSAEKKDNNAYDMHFIGANISVDMESENLDAVKQEMLGQLGDFGDDAALMEDLINGKQIYVSNGSSIWDMYAKVDKDVKATYNSDTNTFLITRDYGYDDMLDQYSYSFLDLSGREHLTEYYKIDGDGKKWITEHYEYDYLADGRIHVKSATYYDYTTQLWTADEYFELPDTSWSYVWRKGYFEDGTLEYESYTDDNGKFVDIGYATYGGKSVVTTNRIYDDWSEGRPVYREENSYYEDGTLCTRSVKDGSFFIEESYYENGNSQMLSKMIPGSEDAEPRYVYERFYFKNGEPKELREFYESGNMSSCYRYEQYPDGSTHIISLYDYYDGEGFPPKKIVSSMTVFTYYPNGETHTETRYFDYEYKRIREYRECYENGENKMSYENNEQGEKINISEWYENGTWKYSYTVSDDGTVDETECYLGDPNVNMIYVKKEHIWFPDGDEKIWEYYESLELKYYYYHNAASGETEEEFYEIVGSESVMTEYHLTEADGTYTVWKYFADGTSYRYMKDVNGNVTETYYDKNGTPIR